VETYGSPHWTDAENIVTNGAYTVGFRRIRDRVRMVKNPYYWNRDEVAFGVIDALSVESLTTAFNMYETGQVDWITKVAPLIARELMKAEQPRDDFNPQPQFTTYFYLINVTRPPLDDVRVRRALNLALDRDEIIRTACAGEVSAHSLVPPGLPEYVSQQCEPMNVAKARELLAEAGFPEGNGFPKLEILYNTEEVHQTIAELIRKQWQRSLGINVTIRNEEWGTYQSSTRFLQFDVARRAWGGDYLDANTFLDMFVTDGENNNTGWSNAEYDRLIKAIQSEPDVAKRREMLQQAERIMMDEMPILPIYFYVNRNLVKPHVRGFYNNLQDIHPVWALSFDREGKTPNEFMRKEVK
jgi:oligopeptide transport system substrate-binding protein